MGAALAFGRHDRDGESWEEKRFLTNTSALESNLVTQAIHTTASFSCKTKNIANSNKISKGDKRGRMHDVHLMQVTSAALI